jgi:hypothetical protein
MAIFTRFFKFWNDDEMQRINYYNRLSFRGTEDE